MAGDAFTIDPAHPGQRAAMSPLVDQIRNAVTDLEVLRVAAEACVVLSTELRTDHATSVTAVDELNTLTDELRADHATFITAVDELNTLTDELRADHATFITLTNELHVDVDLNGAALEAILTKLDNDAGITDTNYVSIHGRGGSGTSIQAAAVAATDVATITAAEATAGPVTITAAEASAGPVTITAPAPSATATNAASDLITSNLTLS